MRTWTTGVDGGNGGQKGVGPWDTPFAIGGYGSTIFLRWWMRFDDAFSWGSGNTASPKVKMFRFGTTSGGDLNTLFYARSGLALEFGGTLVPYSFDPSTDAALRMWNEFVVEIRAQSSASASDGYCRLYRNGALLGSALNRSFQIVGTDGQMRSLWGGPCTQTYPQLYSTSGGGGYMYYDEQAVTNFWSSAYQQGS